MPHAWLDSIRIDIADTQTKPNFVESMKESNEESIDDAPTHNPFLLHH